LASRLAERIARTARTARTGTMENLDKLSATGLPVFDLNKENLVRKDW